MAISKINIHHKLYFLLAISLLSMSCMKDLQDDVKMDTIPIPDGIKVGSVELGAQYVNTAYYDLSRNEITKTGTIFDYDLSFECKPEGWHILLNSSRFMYAGNTNNKNFDEVTSNIGVSMNFDPSDGNLDSTAVGKWFSINGNDTVYLNTVFVIDMGLDEVGIPMGYKKVIFQNLKNDAYTLRHANLDGSEDFTSIIPKDSTVNFIGFTFSNGGAMVNYQPRTSSWDLFFGQYTTLLYSGTDPYPYLVRGVLSSRTDVQAAQYEGDKSFSDFEYADVLTINFTNATDGIGHDWKYYNLEEGFYAVETENVYVIHDASGNYYKMHFLSYFNDEGQNGYPQFEFMKLIP